MEKLEWETLEIGTRRLKVFGGWIVNVFEPETGDALVFVPDPNHEWKL